MKKIIFLNLTLNIIILISFSSCDEDDNINTLTETEIADIVKFHGNLSSNIVVINTQGGPITQLEDEVIQEVIEETQTANALYVNVHQTQTKNPTRFLNSDITFEQAKQFDEQSVIALKRVIDYFKAQSKTVYVLGISFGAFMTQELVADYGIDIADGYLIMVGRLNIEEDTWQPFSQGRYTEYTYDHKGNVTIDQLGEGSSAERRNMARLAAGLGFNRYIDQLGNITNLSKITYVYGNRDEQVGSLSTQEIQFLKDKGATVVLSENGDHDGAITTGLNLLKKTFDIE